MTDQERAKERNRERLEGDEAMMMMMMWTLFMAASMAGGDKPGIAAKNADSAIAEAKRRFI